uniref:Sacsin/Nov domain-containing protein n=1 Tax=Cyprinus carpio TaxID=7962 RepID=A0A8C1IQD4_CYPCA
MPDTIVQCANEADRRLLTLLEIKILESAEVAVHLVDCIKTGSCKNGEEQTIMTWILNNGSILFLHSEQLLTKTKSLSFIETTQGERKQASDVFDPRNKTFQALFETDFFPPPIYTNTQEMFQSLQRLGLKMVFGIEQCGQSEPITQRIKNILKEYDEEIDIFKELLQNAEDAGATTCKFLLDFRKHRDPPETLFDDGMALCSGPCLWIFNNELFSQEDWKNIVKVGSASKENKVEMIGTFGLGFNSVYHVSDIPSILSGNTLLILDPNVTHLEKHILSKGNPGIKLNPFQERLYKRFPGQFKSHEGIFDCDLSAQNSKKSYNGTLIKLPFRTLEEANKSEISSKVYDEERIQSFKNNLTDNSETHLLFLKKIKSLSLQIVPENASTPPRDDQIHTPLKISREFMTSVAVLNDTFPQEIKSTFRNTDIACNNIIDVSRAHIVKIIQEHSERSLTQYWLLYSCFGTQDSLQMFQKRTDQEHVISFPIGGVAVPLHREVKTKAWYPDESLIGQAFCFLPLSIETGLPVHVNGTFAVTSNRKSLWEKGVKSEWNKALLKDAVTSAYITTLLELKKMAQNGHIQNYSFYAFWPNTERVSKTFFPLVESFYSAVAQNGNGKSMDLFSNGHSWCSMDKAKFLNPKIEKNQAVGDIAMKVFLSLGTSCVVSLPTWVRDSFYYCGFKEMIKQKTINWPEFYSIVLKNLSAVDTHNRNLLVLNIPIQLLAMQNHFHSFSLRITLLM